MNNKSFKQSKVLLIIRRVLQLVCFVLLPSLFIQVFNSIKVVFLLIFHGQGTFSSVVPSLILLLAVTAVTMIAGRFFCGWMCAFGSLSDLLYRLPRLGRKKLHRKPGAADRWGKAVKYILLCTIIIFVWGFQLISIPSGSNPWDLFGMLTAFSSWPTFQEILSSFLPAAIILLAILISSTLVERFFCRYLCPLGAYFSLISRIRPLRISKPRVNCGNCALCTRKCSMGIDLTTLDAVKSGECIDCMECVMCCPKKNAHPEMSEQSKNAIVAGTLSCAMIAGGYYLGDFTGTKLNGSGLSSYTQASDLTAGVAAGIADGTYSGSGQGFRGQTDVSVTVADGIITNISVTATSDNDEYINKASSGVISDIISNQSTDVDTVTGATYSSNGIISAVKNALESAGSVSSPTATLQQSESTQETIVPTEEESSVTEATASSAAISGSGEWTDGTYTGSGTGLRGTTTVKVTVSGGKITDISVVSYQDDQRFFEKASSTIISEIIEAQSVDVDAVSGATYSSNGLREAVADALSLDFTPTAVQGGHGH